MGFGTPPKVLEKPDLAVLGSVESFGKFNLSESGSGTYVSEVELKASSKCPGGRDATFYLSILPEFFTADFDEKKLPEYAAEANRLKKGESSPGKSRFYGYKNGVAQSSYRSFIQAASGSEIVWTGEGKKKDSEVRVSQVLAALGEVFNAFTLENPPTLEKVYEVLTKALTNRPIIYVLKQRVDDNGELQEGYNVDGFYAATKDGIAAVTKSAGSKKRKKPLILTWVAS